MMSLIGPTRELAIGQRRFSFATAPIVPQSENLCAYTTARACGFVSFQDEALHPFRSAVHVKLERFEATRDVTLTIEDGLSIAHESTSGFDGVVNIVNPTAIHALIAGLQELLKDPAVLKILEEIEPLTDEDDTSDADALGESFDDLAGTPKPVA